MLTVSHYAAVRALISPDVTAVHLPDAYLSQAPFAPAAVRVIEKRLSGIDVQELTGDAREEAILAMLHQCAAELCVSVPQLVRQTQLQVVVEVQTIDWQAKRAFHLAKVDACVASVVSCVSGTSGGPEQQRARRGLPFGAIGTYRAKRGV